MRENNKEVFKDPRIMKIDDFLDILPMFYTRGYNILKLKYTILVDLQGNTIIFQNSKKLEVSIKGINVTNFKKIIVFFLFKELFNTTSPNRKERLKKLLITLKNNKK